MRLTSLIHSIATGSQRRRTLLTPVGLLVFGGSLILVVVAGLLVDRVLKFPRLLPELISLIVGIPLVMVGVVLCGWCVLHFKRAAGTPVPINPPTELVAKGPYLWTRNPMLTGVFSGLFGIGILLHSVGMVVFSIPAYILLHVIELKYVEEAELEQRFGRSYSKYKREVPMFWPRFWRRLQ